MARTTTTGKTKNTTPTKKKTSTSTRTSSRAQKTPAKSAGSKTSTKSKSPTPRSKASLLPPEPREPLSPERKMDIAGIVLVVVGLLTLLSLLTTNSGGLTQIWTNLLLRLIGAAEKRERA